MVARPSRFNHLQLPNTEIQDDGCKQESKLEATKHSIQIKEKIDEPEAMRNCYNCVADNAVNNDSHKQDDENMEEDLSLENEDLLKNKGGDNPECIETEENIVEQAFTDQPLDLSCQGTFNMYTTSHAFPEGIQEFFSKFSYLTYKPVLTNCYYQVFVVIF